MQLPAVAEQPHQGQCNAAPAPRTRPPSAQARRGGTARRARNERTKTFPSLISATLPKPPDHHSVASSFSGSQAWALGAILAEVQG